MQTPPAVARLSRSFAISRGSVSMRSTAEGSASTARERVLPGRPLVALSIVGLTTLVAMLIDLTGGMPNAIVVGILPLMAASAYLFGWRGGLAHAMITGFLFGPGAVAAELPMDGWQAWALRVVALATVASAVGLLFDRQRAGAAELQTTVEQVRARERDAILALARAAEAKDTDTGDHVRRVQVLSERIALETGMGSSPAQAIGWAAMLHDVGKLHVPDRILMKPGSLTPEEWETMRKHPVWGERILAGFDGFETARRIARWHHENFDGSGYPDGLEGDAIALEARIVRIADAFDAMTSRRVYSDPRSIEEALEELHRYRGSQFDPDLVELLVTVLRSDDGFRDGLDALRSPDALHVPLFRAHHTPATA